MEKVNTRFVEPPPQPPTRVVIEVTNDALKPDPTLIAIDWDYNEDERFAKVRLPNGYEPSHIVVSHAALEAWTAAYLAERGFQVE